jgi:hypothetical protein
LLINHGLILSLLIHTYPYGMNMMIIGSLSLQGLKLYSCWFVNISMGFIETETVIAFPVHKLTKFMKFRIKILGKY